MPSTALRKITTRAKAIRKKHPGKSWKAAIKQAGADYRTGKISGVKKRQPAKARSRTRRRVGAPGVTKFKSPKRVVDVTHYAGGVVGSISDHKRAAKRQTEEKLAWLLVQLTHPMKAAQRRKLLKRKAKYLRDIKALSA